MPIDIDTAYERFLELKENVPSEDERPITDNEATTRLRLIDPILVEVLGWPRQLIEPEVNAGQGRLDYLLRDPMGVCWFIIEAKKRDRDLVSREGHRGDIRFKLTGPVLQRTVWPIVDIQMSEYMGRFMPCFGAVTNGEQWIGFLGRLRPENVRLDDSNAVVFWSLEHIAAEFQSFFYYFSYSEIQQRRLRSLLAPDVSRGVLRCAAPERLVPADEERPLSYLVDEHFYKDLKRALDTALSPILHDPWALEKCFVESRESRIASSRLERLANELGTVIGSASEQYPVEVEGQVQQAFQPGELPSARELAGQGYIARMIGERSAGKSVFLRRFYDISFDPHKQRIILIWIDCEKISPFDPRAASKAALEQLKTGLFDEDGPEWVHIREVYKREWKSLLAISGGEETPQLRQHLFNEVYFREERDFPEKALERFADFAVRNRRKLPCIVIDNCDDARVAPEVLRWAVATFLNTFSLCTVAMEDTALWRLRGAGEDLLEKHGPEQFWLFRPMVREVLENRCQYLRSMLSTDALGTALTYTRLGRTQAWKWTVNPEELVRVVSQILLDDQEIANWIGKLCNYNIHSVLDVCKEILLSPHVRAVDLLAAKATGGLPRRKVLKALISTKSEQFQDLPSDRVANIFSMWLEQDWAPLLPARLLALLRSREDEERNRKEQFPGFIAVEKITALFETHLGIAPGMTKAALQKLLTRELIEPYEPGSVELCYRSARVKITDRGRLHLDWSLSAPAYVRMMLEVDPIVDSEVLQELRRVRLEFRSGTSARNRNPHLANMAEVQMISIYVGYVLYQARRVSPLIAAAELSGIVEYQTRLEERWLSVDYRSSPEAFV